MVLKPVVADEPEPQQPSPVTITVSAADGVTLTISLGNGLFIQQLLSVETMQQLDKLWHQSCKELEHQQQLVADVIKTKR